MDNQIVEKYGRRLIGRLAELAKDIVYIHNKWYIRAHLKTKELGIDVPGIRICSTTCALSCAKTLKW